MSPLDSLDDEVVAFIEQCFTHEQVDLIQTTLSLLQRFDMKFYEDELTRLIFTEIETEEKRLKIFDILTHTVRSVIRDHAIQLDDEGAPTLKELCDILAFLSIVQALEDFYPIKGRLFSFDDPRYVLADLIDFLSELPSHRVLEIVSEVKPGLIRAIQKIALEKETEHGDCSVAYLRNFNRFIKFLGDQDLLALRMFRDGYRDLDYEDLLHLSPYPVDRYITTRLKENITLACLELVGLLLLSRDSYEIPLNHIDQRLMMFAGTLQEQEAMKRLVTAIIGDFTEFIRNGESDG